MFNKLASSLAYIKVMENQFVLRRLGEPGQEISVRATEPFTTQRLLVGSFTAAEATLKEAMQTLFPGRWIAAAPAIVIHPISKIEGGLSEVEQRLLQELGAAVGARKVCVWVGHELSDDEVREQLKGL